MRELSRTTVLTKGSTRRVVFLFTVSFALLSFQALIWIELSLSLTNNYDEVDQAPILGKDTIRTTVGNTTTLRGICSNYKGILRIANGAQNTGAGTMFFVMIANQLLYADMYNLLPWIHLNSLSKPVYDYTVHQSDLNTSIRVKTGGAYVSTVRGHGNLTCSTPRNMYPAAPVVNESLLQSTTYTASGNGVWKSYFEPVVPSFPPITDHDKASCESKALIELEPPIAMITAFHRCWPHSLRSWEYPNLPMALRPPQKTKSGLHDWLGRHRERGAALVRKYYRLLPWMQDLVQNTTQRMTKNCLAMHIRSTDKGHGRTKQSTSIFLPYATAYVKAGGGSIFLATDDALIVKEINAAWPHNISSIIVLQQGAHRSHTKEPVFRQISAHRSTTEALVDIYSMSKCAFFVHGHSAMAEATIYLNLDLHNQSIDIDDPHRPTAKAFQGLVKHVLTAHNESTNSLDKVRLYS